MFNYFITQAEAKSKKSSVGPAGQAFGRGKAKAKTKGKKAQAKAKGKAGAAKKKAKTNKKAVIDDEESDEGDDRVKGNRTAQAVKVESVALNPATTVGRQKYFLDDVVSATQEAAEGHDVPEYFGDEVSHCIMAKALRFMIEGSLPNVTLGTGTEGTVNRWSRVRRALVQWGKQKHKTKTATMSEEDLVNSLAELSRERAPEAQKVLTHAANQTLTSFFAGSEEDVEGLMTFLQDNDIEEMPLSMLPVVSSVQHTLIKELIQKRKSGQEIDFVTALNCIAENVFASMPAQWLTFAAAAVHLYNDNNNQMPENAKAFFPTESIMNCFLSLRTSVVMHLLSQLSAQNMQAKVGTAVAQKKLTFNLVTSSGLVALDAACAAYSQSTPMQAWLQSWTHALTRLSEATFEDEMKSMCDLLRAEFEKNHSEAHPELFSKRQSNIRRGC